MNTDVPAGLCGRCEHSRIVSSARGSRFYLCRLSEIDFRFPKYPPLPILHCEGYKTPEGEESQRRERD